MADFKDVLLSQPRWVALTSALVLLLGLPAAQWILNTLRPSHFPPGPPITPGLGNLLQMPLKKPYLRFQQWSREFGPEGPDGKTGKKAEIIGLKLGTANMVVLSSARVVHELLDKRGDKYSDRLPMWIVDNHILHQPEERGRLIMGYTEPFRKWRRSFQHVLAGSSIKKLLPLLEAEAAELCYKLAITPPLGLANSEDENKDSKDDSNNILFETLVRRWALAPPLLMTSGQRLRDLPDSWLADFYHGQDSLINMILPGNTPPVDLLPPLRYIPEFLASWKTKAREARRLFLRDAYGLLDAGKAHLRRTGTSTLRTFAGMDCLVAKAVRERQDGTSDKKPEHETDQFIAFQHTGFLGAAADTSIATLSTLVLVLAALPEVRSKAREEVDRVVAGVNKGGPPTADMLGEFVYLRACMSEVLRWRPTTPGALPHVLNQEDSFEGYVFPKNTTFIIDAWTIGHDEEMYDRPDEFVPERFLDNPLGLRREAAEGVEGSGGHRRPVYAFGAGRRQCPGEQFSYTYIPLTVAKLLWAFDISAPAGGIDLSIETGFVDGVVTRPAKTPVVLTVRSEERRAALVEDFERTQAVVQGLMG
ncbi:cytochrome P450 [Microdochium trichocladiopsis]|uniref:Cytochrome P450 n=1 Tax=Microdochium trichocladiopsis TaxID=1682393 RepID=A0A9P9BL71_9PEZI|nr:cytochrome P450 [Microdochium trichocladiopsis]KAH7024594.1 cytochrome P450 [Microdochium trichocladiopsis]